MDLVGFQNETYAIVGWSERLAEDVAEGEEPAPEPQLQLDATVWYTDNIGNQQYEIFYGSTTHDEVATGVTRISDEEYAISVHKSPSWQRHVEYGDELQVYLLSSSGSVTWIYNHSSELGSYAPVDIWYSSTHAAIYVLANKLYGEYGFGNQTISLLKIDMNGNLIWEQEHTAFEHNQISAAEIVEYNSNYIMTVANNTNGNFPEFIRFSSGATPGSDSQPFPLVENVFLYGIDYDFNLNEFYTAGYRIFEGGKDALVWKNDAGRGFINDFVVGLPVGNEEFKDVNLSSDGFMAGGIRDNKGEGGDDVFIAHFDPNGTVVLEETMGGVTDDRFNAFWLRDNLESGHFAGYDREYGINESGNAYVGGIVLNSFLQFNGACEIPRIFLVDGMFDFSNSPVSSLISTDSTRNTIIQHAKNSNANVLMLYEADRILSGIHSNKASLLSDLDKLCQGAINNGLRVGIIVGYSTGKINTAVNFMDFATQVNGFSYSGAGKINFMMLEHEIWNPLVQNSSGQYTMTDLMGQTVTSYNDVDDFYAQIVQDHYTLLDHMQTKKTNSANLWKAFDYLAYPFNTQPLGAASPRTISDNAFRLQYTQNIESKSDAVFLMYYATYSWGGLNGRDFLVGTADWQKRLRDFGSGQNTSSIFPLFSAEYFRSASDKCGEGGDHLGRFLDGPPANSSTYGGNNFNSVENTYLTQHNNLSGVSANVSVDGFAWYGYQCYKQKDFPSANNPRISCIGTGWISNQETDMLAGSVDLFPNPVRANLEITGLSNHTRFADIELFSLSGQSVFTARFNVEKGKASVNLQEIKNGAYILKIIDFENDQNHTFKLMVQQ